MKCSLHWRVGWGDQISIWDDLWNSRSTADRLFNNKNNNSIRLVLELINEVDISWKREVLVSTFSAEVANKNMQIPLARSAHEDFLVWRGEPFGEFTIRSTYKLLQEANFDPNNNAIQIELKTFYMRLWNLNIPPKIKITVW